MNGFESHGSHLGDRKRDRYGGKKVYEKGGSYTKWFGTSRERNQWLKKDEPGKKIVERIPLEKGDWETT